MSAIIHQAELPQTSIQMGRDVICVWIPADSPFGMKGNELADIVFKIIHTQKNKQTNNRIDVIVNFSKTEMN